MQNGTRVEANCKHYPRPISRRRPADDCNHPGNPVPRKRRPNRSPPAVWRNRSSKPPGPSVAEATCCDFTGHRRRWSWRRQPTRCNRCAMSGLARSIKGTHNVRAYRLPQIPATLEPKTGAELCCISSGNTASRKFHATNRRHAPRAIAYSAGKPRRNPVHALDVVSMLTKICVD